MVIAQLIRQIELAPELGADLVDRYRSEIAGYTQLPEAIITHDVLPHSIGLIEHLLQSVQSGTAIDPDFEALLRDSAVRRFHQGVPIEGLLQSYRLWALTVWEAIAEAVDRSDPTQVDAGFEVVGSLMTYANQASVIVAQAFFAEVAGINSERSTLRGDVLDALLGAPCASASVERRLAALEDSLAGPNAVVVVRGERSLGAGSIELRQLMDRVRHHLRPPDDRLTLGVRSNEVVAIYPAAEPDSEARIRAEADQLARELPRSVLGIGRRHPGVAGVAHSYGEAADAAAIGDSLERFGRATHFRDVVFDHIARASRYSTSLIEDTLKPLAAYDADHQSQLVATLRAFYESRFSLTQAATALHVHPNTIAYRLRRIHELTDLDPAQPDDLLQLSMGLKLGELQP